MRRYVMVLVGVMLAAAAMGPVRAGFHAFSYLEAAHAPPCNPHMNWAACLAVGLQPLPLSVGAEERVAETALNMASHCKAIADAQIMGDRNIAVPNNLNAGKCWGAFLTIHELG